MPNTEQFDHVFLGILQHLEKVEPFLDSVFCFLARRTDFFRLMHSDTDTMGFPPGVAEKMTMGIFRKYQKLVLGDEAPGIAPEPKKKAKEKPKEKKPGAVASQKSAADHKDKTFPQNATVSADSGGASITVPEVVREEVIQTEAQSAPQSSIQETQASSSETAKDSSAAEASEPESTGIMPSKQAEAYNGSMFDNYHWSQSHTDVDVHVHLPKNTPVTKKDIGVEITKTRLKVYLKNGLTNDDGESVLVEGTLHRKIVCEESMWSLVPRESINVNLEKAEERWWTALIEGEPEIDKSKIDTTKNITEFDEQTQTDFERVMYDHHQKQLGKPTSKEQETHELLKKAWDAKGSPFAGTPFDPSSVNISG